ncbi:MAG: PIN domain-containing protein [Planctomycetes bacterium]|nr:PIN domain-containing protein [Planctomycetota bacterium]
MTDKRPIYCWDTTVFLAWLKEEPNAPLADIDLVAREIDDNKAVLVVPVTITSEILDSRLSGEQRAKLSAFLKRSNIINANTTLDIAKKASEIRDAGLAMKPAKKIKTPDATIVATAIIYQCDALHSLDDKGSGPLRMKGMAVIGSLKICKPITASGQRGLDGFN